MMGLSFSHLLILAVIVLLLLGGGRFSNLMGDVAKGLKNFKKGMAEEDAAPPLPPQRLEAQPEPTVERDGERVRDDRG
jgi:sec-independent protein translocase protein TatA